MRPITLVLPHFCNLGMLAEQQRIWMDYPPDLRSQLHVIIVDDCSPSGSRPIASDITATGLGSVRLFQLLEKKRWNWPACRNLGVEKARTRWLLLTDIDHGIPPSTLERIIAGDLDADNAYRFKRVTAPSAWPYALKSCAPWKPHNDTWLLTRKRFFDPRVGGYDERLSGCYGTSGEFRDRLMAASKAHVMLTDVIVRYPREVIPDASTPPSVYTRKGDPKNDEDLKHRKAARALITDWQPLRGLVPWEEVRL